MDFEVIEKGIRDKLLCNENFQQVSNCIIQPETKDEFRLPDNKALVVVQFVQEKFYADNTLGEVSQLSTLSFSLSILSLKLRGATGVYAVAELVKQILIGSVVNGSQGRQLSLESHSHVDYWENGVWEHNVVFTMRSIRVQDDPYLMPSDDITDGLPVTFDKITSDETIHIQGCSQNSGM